MSNLARAKNVDEVRKAFEAVEHEKINALYSAIERQDVDSVRYLLEHGVNPNIDTGEFRPSILCKAANRRTNANTLEIVELLLNHGATRLDDAIRCAGYVGNKEIIQLVLDRGGIISRETFQNIISNHPLELGRYKLEFIEFLLDNSNIDEEDITQLFEDFIDTIIETRISITDEGEDIDEGDDIDEGEDIDDELENKWMSLLQLFIDHGANIHQQNDKALVSAAEYGENKIVKLLIDNGAHVRGNDEALFAAAANGHIDTVELLVEQGANIHARNDEALRRAATNGQEEMVGYLLDQGLDANKGILGRYVEPEY